MNKLKRYFIVLMTVIMTVGALPISVLAQEASSSQRTIITNLPPNITIDNYLTTATQIANNQIVSAPNSSPSLQAMVFMNMAIRQLTEHSYILLLHYQDRPGMQERIVNYLNDNLEAVTRAITHVHSATEFPNAADMGLWESWRNTIEAIGSRQFDSTEEAMQGLRIMWGNVAAMHRDTALLLNGRPNHHLYLNEITGTISSIRYMQNFPSRWDDEQNRIVPTDQFEQSVINEFVNTSQFNNLVSRNEMDQDEQVHDQIAVMTREFSARIQENIAFVTLHDPESLQASYLEANPESPFHFLNRLTGPNMWKVIPGTAFLDPVSQEEGVHLRDLYLAGFAASAAHIPFISRSGDEQFLDAVTYLLGVQDNVDRDHEVRTRIGEILQFSKPLYAVHDAQGDAVTPLGASFIDVNGPATRMTLGQLLTIIDENGTFAAGVIPGHMSQAGDTWEYFNAAVNVSNTGDMFITIVVEESSTATTINSYIRVVLEVDGYMGGIVRDREWWQITGDGMNRGADHVFTAVNNAWNWLIRNDAGIHSFMQVGASNLQNPTPGSITFGLMTNIVQSLDMRGRLSEFIDQPLVLTVFGDITTTCGLVVLPAAANPTFFAQPIAANIWMYNPFTAAFFNSYPVISGSRNSPQVANNRDMSKWFFAAADPSELVLDSLDAFDLLRVALAKKTGGLNLGTSTDLRQDAFNQTAVMSQFGAPMVSFLPVTERRVRAQDTTETALVFPFFTAINVHGSGFERRTAIEVLSGTVYIGRDSLETQRQTNPIQLQAIRSVDGISILPHYISEVNSGARNQDERRIASRVIAANMLAYITMVDENGNITNWLDDTRPSGNGMLRENFMFTDVALPVLDGMVHPRRYHQNAIHENMLFNQDAGVFSRHFRQIAHSIISTSFTVENFIGVSSPTDGSILSPIYQMIHRHWGIVFLLLATVLLIMFVFTRNFTKTMLAGGSIVAVTFVLLYLVPITLPTILGNLSNSYTRRLVQQSMLVRGENYTSIFSNETDGFMGSLKLYNMSMNESMNLRSQLGYDTTAFMTQSIWMDDRAGVFLQGTEIRIDLQTLWTQNTISTRFTNSWSNYDTPSVIRRDLQPYRGDIYSDQLHLFNRTPNISMVNYYMPYLFLQDGLVYTLNQFLRHYRVPRAMIQFVDGNVQDSYVVASFIRSIPFLAVLPHVQLSMSENIAFSQDADILRNYFPDAGDIFRIQWLVDTEFTNLPPYVANTVWGQTMRRAGFYGATWSYTRRQLLVNYVNDAGYRFFINISAQPGLHSDENLIKLAALEATFAFNRFISEFGDMVYPQHFSTSYLSVGDIIAAGLIHQNPFFIAYDIDILPIVLHSRGYGATFLVVMVALFMIAIAFVNGNLAILYVAIVLFSIVIVVWKKTVRPALVFSGLMFASLFGLGLLSIGAWHVFWWLPPGSSIHWLAVMYLLIIIAFIFMVIQTVKTTIRSVSNAKTNEENAFDSLKNKVMRQ